MSLIVTQAATRTASTHVRYPDAMRGVWNQTVVTLRQHATNSRIRRPMARLTPNPSGHRAIGSLVRVGIPNSDTEGMNHSAWISSQLSTNFQQHLIENRVMTHGKLRQTPHQGGVCLPLVTAIGLTPTALPVSMR